MPVLLIECAERGTWDWEIDSQKETEGEMVTVGKNASEFWMSRETEGWGSRQKENGG